MRLKTIYLSLDVAGLPTSASYDFLLRSRVVCNFLEREVLRRVAFDAEGFNRLSITVTDEPRKVGVFVNSEKVACVDVPFDRKAYARRMSDDGRTRYFMERLREGIAKGARVLELPKAELLAGLKAFEAGGLRNEWVQCVRQFKKQGLTASLRCRLTPKAFRLALHVEQGGVVLLQKPLLRMKPNELVFEPRFKDVLIVKDRLVVTRRLGAPLWSTPLATLKGPARQGARSR